MQGICQVSHVGNTVYSMRFLLQKQAVPARIFDLETYTFPLEGNHGNLL